MVDTRYSYEHEVVFRSQSLFSRLSLRSWNVICRFAGQLLLAKGEIDNAYQAFTIGLGTSDDVPALLGQV